MVHVHALYLPTMKRVPCARCSTAQPTNWTSKPLHNWETVFSAFVMLTYCRSIQLDIGLTASEHTRTFPNPKCICSSQCQIWHWEKHMHFGIWNILVCSWMFPMGALGIMFLKLRSHASLECSPEPWLTVQQLTFEIHRSLPMRHAAAHGGLHGIAGNAISINQHVATKQQIQVSIFDQALVCDREGASQHLPSDPGLSWRNGAHTSLRCEQIDFQLPGRPATGVVCIGWSPQLNSEDLAR